MMVALSTPLLVASTGLAVDIGYWYQEQTNLQSAADAGAMAAASAELSYGSSGVSTTTAASPFAVAAANAATNNQYNFSSTTLVATPTILNSTSGKTQWVAIATAKRQGFFSGVMGMGVAGIATGSQSASASADYAPASSPACLIGTGTSGPDIVSTGNNGKIVATNCSIAALSTSCNGSSSAISSTGGQIIEAPSLTVGTGGCGYASGGGSYVGPTSSYSYAGGGLTTGVTATATPPTYPAAPSAAISSASWPAMPSGTSYPTITPGGVNTTYTLNMNTATNGTSGGPATWDEWVNDNISGTTGAVNWSAIVGSTVADCIVASSGNTCYMNSGGTINNINFMANGGQSNSSSINVHALTINYNLATSAPDRTGGTIINSGITSNSNFANLFIDGSYVKFTNGTYQGNGQIGQLNYYGTIATSAGISTINNIAYEFNGPFQFQTPNNNSTAGMSLGLGNYYLYNAGGYTFYYIWSNTGNTLNTAAGSSFYVNGTIRFGTAGTFNFAAGSLYEFNTANVPSTAQTCNPNSSISDGQNPSTTVNVTAGLTFCGGNFNFNGGTYFFNGGLYTVNGGTNVYFGPGIYYVENGTLDLWGANSVTANGATFVIGSGGSLIIGNSTTLSLAAPDDLTTANAATLVAGASTPANDPNYDSGCVEPANYTGTSLGTWPYGGTNGHGICGVLIYQDSTNTNPILIQDSNTGYLNGLIYAPNAMLDFGNGNGTIKASTAANTSGTLEMVTSKLLDPSTQITLSAANSSGSGASTSSSIVTLVQ